MDMFVYIFTPATQKYATVKGSSITNFYYETPGRQSSKFWAKPFQHTGTDKKVSICQILIVAATRKELNELISQKRIAVPKLNKSDLEIANTKKNDTEVNKARKAKSNQKKAIAKNISRTNSKIIEVHLSKTFTHPANVEASETPKTNVDDTSNDSFNNKEDDLSDTASNKSDSDDGLSEGSTVTKLNKVHKSQEVNILLNNNDDNLENNSVHSKNDEDDYENNSLHGNNNDNSSDLENDGSHDNNNDMLNNSIEGNHIRKSNLNNRPVNIQQNESENPRRFHEDDEMCTRLIEEKRKLKGQVSKLRSEKVAVQRVNRILQDKLEKQKKQMIQNSEGAKKQQLQLKPKGCPTPICCNSGVFVRADALEEAYQTTKPSLFYERLCYLTWGRKLLAKRCVKRCRSTPQDITVLTPKKRRAVRKHFIHYLKYFKYHSVLFSEQLGKMNAYANRAISCSKRHAQLIEDHQLQSDSEIESETEQVEL